MAHLLNLDGNVAEFLVNDNLGNSAVGHIEFTTVPSFEPGTRIGDISFVIDRTISQVSDPQAPLNMLRGPVS